MKYVDSAGNGVLCFSLHADDGLLHWFVLQHLWNEFISESSGAAITLTLHDLRYFAAMTCALFSLPAIACCRSA